MDMVKKILAIILCLVVILGSGSVYAEDNGSESLENTLTNSLTENFDVASGMYIEKIDKGLEFLSSIPNGAIVSDGVYLDIPTNIAVILTCEGNPVSFLNQTPLTAPGYYIMKLSATNSVGESKVSAFTFRISDPPKDKVNVAEYKYPKISCTANVTSDSATGLSKYTLPNYKAFFTDVPQYGISVESARFIIPRNLGYTFKRNGKQITLINNKVYDEYGSYSLKIFGYSVSQGTSYDACYETVLNFTIPQPESPSADDSAYISQALQQEAYSYGSNSSESSYIPEILQPEQSSSFGENIISDTLLESYFESANIYSETFSSGDAFYTNTPNDGIVGGNVYIDVPYNMSVSMTKDGIPAGFKNKTYINEEGSYSLIFTDVYDGNIATARYSFRIQAGTDKAKAIAVGDDGTAEGVSEGSSEGETQEGQKEEAKNQVKYSLKNQYDKDKGMYVFDCGDKQFYASVPDGMFSNYEVLLDIPEGLEATIEKNGEEIDLTSSITENGRYSLEVRTDKDKTKISFDVADYSVNYIDEFIAPEGYSFIVAEYNDYNGTYTNANGEEGDKYINGLITIEAQNENLSNVFKLPIDGEYSFIMQGSRGMPVLSASIILDTNAPIIEFENMGENMRTTEKSVNIICNDTEAKIELTDKKGNASEIALSDGKAVINGSGKYKITARDSAGNVSDYDFVLGSKGISVSVIVIIICVIILAIVVIAIILLRKGIINNILNGKMNIATRPGLPKKKEENEQDKKEKPKRKKKPLFGIKIGKKADYKADMTEDENKKNNNLNDFWNDNDHSENDGWEDSETRRNDDWEHTEPSGNDEWENVDYSEIDDDWESSDDDDWENN